MGSVVYLLEKDMSKKLLALLVAVSTCCAFGCSDDDSDSCKTGEKRCDGNNAQICVNGNWSKGTPCANGCDKATGVCKEKAPETGACTTAGEKRCSGKQLQECKDGNWSKLEDCTGSCDEATKACKDDGGSGTTPEVGSPCDKSTFQQVCINGGANALVCWDDVVKQWNCANNDCKANADKPLQVICAKGDTQPTTCTGEKVTTGGEEGACCDAATYQVSCINDNANALICAKGAVKKWTCKDNICSVGSDNKVKCDNPNGTGGGSGTGGTGTGEACDKATTNPVCNEAGDKVTYCSSSNELKEKDCPQCYVNGSIFWCNGDQNLTNCVEGGTSKCRGNCVSDTLGYIWNKNENMVKEYTCTAPKKCTDNGAGYLSCK